MRAEKLDECLEILELAWSGDTVGYQGTHYQMEDLHFRPASGAASAHPGLAGGRLAVPEIVAARGTLGRSHRLRHVPGQQRRGDPTGGRRGCHSLDAGESCLIGPV